MSAPKNDSNKSSEREAREKASDRTLWKGVADQAHGRFRRWFRRIWKVRGGGLYACGFAVAFLFFEVRELVLEDIGQVAAADLMSSEIIDLTIGFVVDSFINLGKAFAWPVYVITWEPPLGAIALGIAFAVFPITLKKPIERWLFHDQPTEEQGADHGASSRREEKNDAEHG